MRGRIDDFATKAGDGYKGMRAVEGYLANSDIPEPLQHLVKLRVSQVNGCAFCVDMHGKHAKQAGETDERLFGVAAWRESPHFTSAERAALDLAEASTRLADNPHGVPDEVYEAARAEFDEQTLTALVMLIATTNAWNRISVINRTVPGSHTPR
ncbi:carboxymuconolactone decarboxylase family protein [Saccharopolyspora rhizosphaerae]|uniref:Carboxymuconolactone decarboxylase family protein n=1 Tax=Saccharopolyspora rhizosphaerae TaxID=2492662 RepID=A0A426JRF4_9PSEU|nr:carboxymuconolactone decarboxylase family protein [Saccharopolyspora rhizosphaerae]RRO15731.1 carboxymuconolactone decarboxylase family protein [Saccharopolyspora rhizosphaerae]